MNLFEIKEENKNKLHPNFQTLLYNPFKDCRNVINCWAEDFIDRDKKFVNEFQTTFDSSFWELYCFAVLRDMDYKVNFKYNRPDFIIERDNEIQFIIECTIAKHPDGGIPEYDLSEKIIHNTSIEECVDLSTIRLSNSINSKSKLYVEKYSKLEYVENKPFIIAIAPFDQPNFQIANLQAIRRVLYGTDLKKIDKDYYEINCNEISKKNGSKIDLGIFKDEKFNYVSGILFSCLATTSKTRAIANSANMIYTQFRFNKSSHKSRVSINYTCKKSDKNDVLKQAKKDEKNIRENIAIGKAYDRYSFNKPLISEGYFETLTDGLHLFLNPFAKNKISEKDINKFYSSGINLHSYDIKNDIETDEDHDNHLLQRAVKSLKRY